MDSRSRPSRGLRSISPSAAQCPLDVGAARHTEMY
jgi:hypothetical protein